MNLLKRKTRESSETQSTTMEVYFSGPSVDEHSMSVRDLAPALIGLADAIDRYKELSCPFADLDVRITATKAGSFDVILQILGTVKPGEHEVVERHETRVALRIGKTAKLNVSRKSYRASCDGKIINDLGTATKPASEDGYNPVRFIHKDSGSDAAIPGDVSESMSVLTLSDQPIEPSVETTTLQIDTIQFQSRKWKFSKGDEKFWCEIADEAFLARLNRHEVSFCSGDLLKVKLETEQYVRDGRLETGSRRITKVIEHIPIERQQTLDI